MHLPKFFCFCRPGLALVLAVTLSHSATAGQIYSTDFSGGSLGAEWAVSSTHDDGIVKIAERGGRPHVLSMNLKGKSAGISTVNHATLSVDITGFSDIKLSFDHHAEHDPVTQFASGSFLGIPDATGVAISSNGTDWVPLWSPDITHENGWDSISNLDVSSLIAANASLSATGLLRIRFQQFMQVDSGYLRSDGRGWDNVALSFAPVPEPSTGLLLAIGAASAMGLRIRRR